MQSVFEKMAKNKPVFAISDTLSKTQLLFHDTHPDPHIWFDLTLWHQAGLVVLQHLQQQDPAHKADYQAQAEAYLAQMSELNTWVKHQIERIPAQQRVLITAHDAFGYFGQAYGLKVLGLQGVSTASEFGLQDLKRLKDIIIQQKIKAVFVESSVSPRLIQSLVEGSQAEGHALTIGGELYSDAMGLAGTPSGTYFGMVKHNVTTLVNALK
jgi:manganese/zinc/iron transport system substrate-binding protein